MEKSLLTNICKYFLFFVNLLVFILGLVILGCGITVLADSPWFLQILNQASEICGDGCDGINNKVSEFSAAAGLFIAMAVFITFVAFLGCCGAWKENRCMLITFFSILLVIFICMIAACCVAANGDFATDLEENMVTAMKQYDDQSQTADGTTLKELWNEAQAELQCCGVSDVTDWQESFADYPKFPNFEKGIYIPEGCCTYNRTNPAEKMDDKDKETCQKISKPEPDSEVYFFDGCYTHYYESAKEYKGPMEAVAAVIMIFMFLNLLFSCAFCIILDHEEDEINWNNVQLRRSMRYDRLRN